MEERQTVVIVGAGVIGLSVALSIQPHLRPSQALLIVARDFPHSTSINYATPWAGAHYRPIPGHSTQLAQEAAWAKRSYDVFRRIATEEPASGVQLLTAEEYFENPSDDYRDAAANVPSSSYAHLSGGFSVMTPHEINDPDVRLAIRYKSYCVNAPVYAAHLLRKFTLGGGQTREYTLASLKEAFSMEKNVNVVINCSGMGISDPKAFIIRGQTCLVSNTCSKTITRQNRDGSWSFAIPRSLGGGTIIGGTKQPDVWDPKPSEAVRETLLANAAKWFPFAAEDVRQFTVIRDIVGRRPAREGGVRLETENITVNKIDGTERMGHVVHAYGCGGRGIEISWGVAEDVLNKLLAAGTLKETARL